MDCSLPGFSVHGVLQAGILECIAISFSKYCMSTVARSLMGCVLTCTCQLCMQCIYTGTSKLHKRGSTQMMGLWKVPGRKSEAESQDLPTTHSPAQLRSPSRFHQDHSRIPVPPPHLPTSSQGSSQTWVPGALRGLTCRVQSPLAQTQPWK